MKLIAFVIILLMFSGGRSDTTTSDIQQAKEFISFILETHIYENNIVLSDVADIAEYKNCFDWMFRDTLLIGSAARQTIFHAIDNPLLTRWNSDLVKKSRIVSADTIRSIFANPKTKGWEYFNNKYGPEFYVFALPIFFENDTMCLFYMERNCGEMCSEGEIILYKKKERKWTAYRKFCYWMS